MPTPIIFSLEPVQFFRQLDYIREAPVNNTGRHVEGIQVWNGATPGEPEAYCADTVSLVLDVCTKGQSPFGALRSVAGYLAKAQMLGLEVVAADDVPHASRPVQPGDLYAIHTTDESHIGMVTRFVTGIGSFDGISGNTSTADGKQGIAEHTGMTLRTVHQFILIPR